MENIKKKSIDANVKWKCELADAILEEAIFKGTPINIGDKIEHQLGTIWVGMAAIQINELMMYTCDHCKEEVSLVEIINIPSIEDWCCPHCKKINKTN